MLIIKSSLAIKMIFVLSVLHLFFLKFFHLNVMSVGKILDSSLLIISMFLLIIFSYKQFRKYGKKIGVFFVPYTALIVWSFFTIIRELSTDTSEMITLFGNYYLGAATWMTPLALLFGFKINNWQGVFKILVVIQIVAIIFLPIYLLNIFPLVENAIFTLFFSVPLFIFFFPLLKKKYRLIVIGFLISYLITSFVVSSRTTILVLFISIILLVIEYLRNSNVSMLRKNILMFIVISLISFFSLNSQKLINKALNNDELVTDTRTFLFVELFDDMTINEQIIGRGALGTYFSPVFDYLNIRNEGIDSSNRGSNEIGYLNLILKGGYIMLILYLIVLLPIAFLGIIKGKNSIIRAFGYYVLIILILMSINYTQAFDGTYLLLWFAAGAVLNKEIRMLTNTQISDYIYQNKFKSIFSI